MSEFDYLLSTKMLFPARKAWPQRLWQWLVGLFVAADHMLPQQRPPHRLEDLPPWLRADIGAPEHRTGPDTWNYR